MNDWSLHPFQTSDLVLAGIWVSNSQVSISEVQHKSRKIGLPVKMEAQVHTLRLLAQPQRELQLNLKTNNIPNCQKIELYGSLTTKDLRKPYSSR